MSQNKNVVADVMKDLVFDVVLKRVIEKVVTLVPFFGLPVISQIFVFAVTKLLKIIWIEAEMYAAFLKIDAKVNAEVERYSKAKEKLEKNPESEEAQNEFKDSFIDLIYLGD